MFNNYDTVHKSTYSINKKAELQQVNNKTKISWDNYSRIISKHKFGFQKEVCQNRIIKINSTMKAKWNQNRPPFSITSSLTISLKDEREKHKTILIVLYKKGPNSY